MRFFRLADRMALPIPNDLAVASAAKQRLFDGTNWPTPALWPFLALAQHHGIPTRLLDWSRNAKAAAFFAAADAAAQAAATKTTLDGDLAIWAVRADFITRFGGEQLDVGKPDLTLELVTVPHSSNSNLHAQAGLFTLTRGLLGNGEHFRALPDVITLLVNRRVETGALPADDPATRPLRKIVVPSNLAPTLLRSLHDDQVTGAALFPGYDGVVRSLQVETLWDNPSGDLRSLIAERAEVARKWSL